jgi:hypothetical protein
VTADLKAELERLEKQYNVPKQADSASQSL